jgi:hypothetical protein
MSKAIKLELTTPIKAHGAAVTELTFRPPTGKDIRQVGNPFDMLTPGKDRAIGERVNDAKMAAMIERLASIPSSSVDTLSFTDWNACTAAVMSFLETPGRLSSIDTTNAPPSGATSDT